MKPPTVVNAVVVAVPLLLCGLPQTAALLDAERDVVRIHARRQQVEVQSRTEELHSDFSERGYRLSRPAGPRAC